MKYATINQIEEIKAKSKAKLAEILETKSVYPEGRTTYYVDSENGCDEWDGLSPETAWRTLEKVTNTELGNGSVVLFRTGKFVDHPLAEEYLNKLVAGGVWGKNDFYRIPCDDSSFDSLLK